MYVPLHTFPKVKVDKWDKYCGDWERDTKAFTCMVHFVWLVAAENTVGLERGGNGGS